MADSITRSGRCVYRRPLTISTDDLCAAPKPPGASSDVQSSPAQSGADGYSNGYTGPLVAVVIDSVIMRHVPRRSDLDRSSVLLGGAFVFVRFGTLVSAVVVVLTSSPITMANHRAGTGAQRHTSDASGPIFCSVVSGGVSSSVHARPAVELSRPDPSTNVRDRLSAGLYQWLHPRS